MATQAHPELKSRPTDPHPLFVGFVAATRQHRREVAGRLPVDLDDPPLSTHTSTYGSELDEPTAAEVSQAASLEGPR